MDAALRDLVRHRAADRCEYCRLAQQHAPVVRFHIDHILARVHGGSDDPSNLALACPHCNNHKGTNFKAIDPDTDQEVPVFDPRRHSWHEHFRLEGVSIIGLTPIGRATVRLLQMNAESRLDVRRPLQRRGELSV